MKLRSSTLAIIALVAVPAAAHAASPAEVCASKAEEGQRLRSSGSLRAARDRFVACGAKTCPRAVRGDCARWLSEVESAMPTVVFHAYDKNKVEITDVRVTVDDVESFAADGLPVSLDPGPHTLRVEAAQGQVTQKIVAAQGEKNRLVSVTLVPPAPPAPPPAAPAPRDPPSFWSSPGFAYGVTGVGASVLLTGTVFWGLGVSDRAGLRDTCGLNGTCSPEAVDSARSRLVVGDVLVLAGALVTGAGIYLILHRDKAEATSPAAWLRPLTF